MNDAQTFAALIGRNAKILSSKLDIPHKTARFEVELLLERHLNLSREQIQTFAITGQLISDVFANLATISDFDDLIERRVGGEPLQYITQTAPFFGLELEVGAGVFIPRPETEKLVELALTEIRAALEILPQKPLVIADLCAGSGAIGIAIARALQEQSAQILAVEKSAVAYNYLVRNCAQNADGKITPILADATRFELPALDVVVMNPPYIPPGVMLPDDVRAEPDDALWGRGDDGFEVPRAVIANAARSLNAGGKILIEHFENQNKIAKNALKIHEFIDIEHITDLNGRPRFTVGTKS
jgi:release factor glutamine methyltransferase